MTGFSSLSLIECGGLLLIVGATGGFLSGLLGIGGGLIFVPALYFCFSLYGVSADYAMHLAVGSSLAIVAATVSVSARAHHRLQAVDLAVVKSWGPFLATGVVLGTMVAGMIDGQLLKQLFAGLTALIAVYMVRGREILKPAAPRFLTPVIQKYLCLPIGGAAALTGIGGAVLTVPLMIVRGLSMSSAVGTGTALGLLIAVPGMIGYIITGWAEQTALPPFSVGYVNLLVAAIAISMSVLTAPYGVIVSHRLDKTRLRRIFAVVLICVSLKMFLSL